MSEGSPYSLADDRDDSVERARTDDDQDDDDFVLLDRIDALRVLAPIPPRIAAACSRRSEEAGRSSRTSSSSCRRCGRSRNPGSSKRSTSWRCDRSKCSTATAPAPRRCRDRSAGIFSGLQGLGRAAIGNRVLVIIVALAVVALLAFLAWVALYAAGVARRRIRLSTDQQMRALWEAVGAAGDPPRDESYNFAVYAIVLLIVAAIVVPAAIGLLVGVN